jgi:integrase
MAATDFLLYRDRVGRYADFHAFRHATGSFLAQGGVSPKVAQTIMRHSDINLTMSTYSHAYREDEARAVERLPDLGRRPPAK